jgi:hypothetical protein
VINFNKEFIGFSCMESTTNQFEQLLGEHGINIENGSTLEDVILKIKKISDYSGEPISIDTDQKIRQDFTEAMGISDFMVKIYNHRNHKDFKKLLPHLRLLNCSSAPQNMKSATTDQGSNKLFELYIALLCMSISNDVDLDDPENSKGDNPDVMFSWNNVRWGIACKVVHTKSRKTIIERVLEGYEQIARSSSEKGIVIVNFKNIVDINKIWPILQAPGEESLGIRAFDDKVEAIEILANEVFTIFSPDKTQYSPAEKGLALELAKQIFPGLVAFSHASTGVIIGQKPCPTLLRLLNKIPFGKITDDYDELLAQLNKAMHDIS